MTRPSRKKPAPARPEKVAPVARSVPATAPARAKRSTLRRPLTSLAGPDLAGVGPLIERVVAILEEGRAQVVRSVNCAMVLAYWHVGREIVEYHQGGARRAEYGDRLLVVLSARLQQRVGRGYSATNLKYFRIFYQVYAEREPRIRHEARDELVGHPEIRREARDVSRTLALAGRPADQLDGF